MAGVLLDEGLRDRERLAKVEGRLEVSCCCCWNRIGMWLHGRTSKRYEQSW